MKSPMVQNALYIKESDKENYSDLKVLRSNAGYYIGTVYTDPKDPYFVEPGSRDTGYFATKEEAEAELALLEKGESNIEPRMMP